MTKLLSNIFSVMLHPALMTTYSTMIMFNTGADYPYLNTDQKLFVYGFVFLITFMLPISTTPLYIGLGLVKSVFMTTHKERAMPLLISSLAFYLAYHLLNGMQMNSTFLNFLLLNGLLVAITGVISFFWKISAHMIGLGGLVGLMPALAQKFSVNMNGVLIVAVLLAGLMAAARLHLGSHNQSQIYSGFFLGFIVIFLGVLLI